MQKDFNYTELCFFKQACFTKHGTASVGKIAQQCHSVLIFLLFIFFLIAFKRCCLQSHFSILFHVSLLSRHRFCFS